MNSYRVVGLMLMAVGALLALGFTFVFSSVPLAATGLSAVIIGLTSTFLAGSRPRVSPEACQILMRTGVENVTALLEAWGVKDKGIYVPRNMNEGHPRAIIPLSDEEQVDAAKERFVGNLLDAKRMTIAVATPGSISLDLLKSQPGPTADDIGSAITYIVVGVLDIAKKVKVDIKESRIDVRVSGVDFGYEDTSYYRCLGTPIGSIVAAISSEALQKPVRIVHESKAKGTSNIALEILP